MGPTLFVGFNSHMLNTRHWTASLKYFVLRTVRQYKYVIGYYKIPYKHF